jgi:hypothetical protein
MDRRASDRSYTARNPPGASSWKKTLEETLLSWGSGDDDLFKGYAVQK